MRRGKVRRAKLYYLRGLRGKSARIAEAQGRHGGNARRAKARRPSNQPPRRFARRPPRAAFFMRHFPLYNIFRFKPSPTGRPGLPRFIAALGSCNCYRSCGMNIVRPTMHTAFVLRDRDRLPGRVFGRMTASIQGWPLTITDAPQARRAVSRAQSKRFLSNRDPIMPPPPKPRTLYDKIWDDHVVDEAAGRHLPALYRPPSGA